MWGATIWTERANSDVWREENAAKRSVSTLSPAAPKDRQTEHARDAVAWGSAVHASGGHGTRQGKREIRACPARSSGTRRLKKRSRVDGDAGPSDPRGVMDGFDVLPIWVLGRSWPRARPSPTDSAARGGGTTGQYSGSEPDGRDVAGLQPVSF